MNDFDIVRSRRGGALGKGPRMVPGAQSRALTGTRAPTPAWATQIPDPNPVSNTIRDVNDTSNPYSPQQPVMPFGQSWGAKEPVDWDYWPGINLQFQPPQVELFSQLKVMARGWGVLASVIQKRIDQLRRLPFDFQIKGSPKKTNARLEEIREFFVKPDRKHSFNRWSRLLLSDHFEIDAPALYVHRALDDRPYALEVLDGSKIKPLIDDLGRRPDYPSPAYQQVRRGLPYLNLTERDIIYAPMRSRPDYPIYGVSPVEFIFLNISEAIKKDVYLQNFWTSGNLPDLIITVPDSWKPQQIASFQAFFEQYSGNPNFKSRCRFVPGGMKPFDIKNANGESMWGARDEILIRICCFAFGMSPQALMKMVNRATAETAQEEAETQGLHPEMDWWKNDLIDPIIQDPDIGFGYDDIECVFKPDTQVDQLQQMQTITGYVKSGLMKINEGRDVLDLQEDPAGNELIVETVNGPVPLKETIEANRATALAVPQQVQNDQESHDVNIAGQKKQQAAPQPKPVGGGQKSAAATFPGSAQIPAGFLRRRA